MQILNNKKVFHMLVLFSMLTPLVGDSLAPIIQPATVAYAAKKHKNKDGDKTKKGLDDSSSDKKGSGNEKKVEVILDKQANLYNPAVPAGAQSSITDALKYNKDMQVLVTYSILKAKYGDTSAKNYKSLWVSGGSSGSTPSDMINDFNKADIGYKLPKDLGNKKILRSLSQYKSQMKQMAASDQITTGTPDGENKDTNNSDNHGNWGAAKSVANKLATNTLKATGLNSSRNPNVKYWHGGEQTNSGMTVGSHPNVTGAKNTIKNGITYVSKKAFGNSNGKYHGMPSANYSYSNIHTASSTSESNKSLHNELAGHYAAIINRQININSDVSAKKLQGKLNNLRAIDMLTGMNETTLNSNATSPYNWFIGRLDGGIAIPVPSKDKASAKEHTHFLNPMAGQVGESKFDGKWKKWMYAKANNAPSKSKLAKAQKKNQKAAADDAKSIGDEKGIGWNWLAPYVTKNTQTTPQDNLTIGKDGLLRWTTANTPVQISTAALTMQLDKGKDKTGKEFKVFEKTFNVGHIDVYGGLNGKDKAIAENPINIASTHAFEKDKQFNDDNNILKGWHDTLRWNHLGDIPAGDNVVGYDTYGNIVEGQTGPSVIVPYWQNWTIKGFGNPKITVNANLNDGTYKFFKYGSSSEFKGATSAVSSFGGSGSVKDFASKLDGTNLPGNGNNCVAKLNSFAGGSKSSSSLSNKAAAELAVVISALTQDKVKAFNSQMLNQSQLNGELYLGKSTGRHNKKGPSGSGTYLYTATDIIQRAGLATDYGFFDSIRKTIVAGLVNTYNNGFIQSGQQDIFHTTTSSETGTMNNLGLLPFYLVAGFLGIVFLYILFRQVILRDNRFGAGNYVSAIFKIVLIMALIVSIPAMDQLLLNKPGEWAINKPLKEQSVLDQWSDLRQQQAIQNVLYSGLFGETFGQINTSQSYTLKFYTTTPKGSNAKDKLAVQGPNPKAVDDKSVNSRDMMQNMTAEQKAALKGNGKVSVMAPYQYKTVNIAATDVLAWAIHMDRQLKTAQQAAGGNQVGTNNPQTGEQKDSTSSEQPNPGYKPGQTPLFVWLDKFYEPLGTRGKHKNGKEYGTTVEGTSYGSGDSAYGKRRNPADTSLKSAYRTGRANNQENNNEDKYKGLSKYTEFAVNTKHYATSLDKQYGIDQDSQNKADTNETDNKTQNGDKNGTTMLTASDLFLRIWETTFSTINSNQNDPTNKTDNKANQDGEATKGAQNYLALAQFAAAMRGFDDVSTPENNSGTAANDPANQQNKNNMTSGEMASVRSNIGATGRKDLINELAMTSVQRAAQNGGGEKFSKAASDIMHAYHIPFPTHDWLNLENDNSPLDVLHPYYGKKQNEVRDGLIHKINTKFLNDYVNTYSTVRFSTGQADKTAENNSQGNENYGDVDSFSMAEAEIMALDEFFTINHYAHERMFPQGYAPSSISLDSWNRMLLIPIGQMKNRTDDSQYNIWEDKINPADIALQDNVAEYIGLRSNIPSLFMFIVMNVLLIVFGKILSFFVAFIFPILLVFSLFRAFFKGSHKITDILLGALVCKIMLGLMKLLLIATYAYMSSAMNNSYVNNNGKIELPILKNCTIISIEVLLCFWFILKVWFPAVRNSLGDFGGRNVLRNMGGNFRSAYNNSWLNRALGGTFRFARTAPRMLGRSSFHTIVRGGRHAIAHPVATTKTINRHVQNIGHAITSPGRHATNIIRDIHNRGLMATVNGAKDAIMEKGRNFGRGIYNKHLATHLNNMQNAWYGSVAKTHDWGLTDQKIADATNGQHIQTINNAGKLHFDLTQNGFTPDQIAALASQAKNIQGVSITTNNNGRQILTFDKVAKDNLNNADARKQIVDPYYQALRNMVNNTKFTSLSAREMLPTFGAIENGKNVLINAGVGRDISTNLNKAKSFINSMEDEGYKLSTPLQLTPDGKHLMEGSQLRFVPMKNVHKANMQRFLTDKVAKFAQDSIAPQGMANAYNFGVDALTEANARKLAENIPDAKVVGSRVMVQGNSQVARSALSAAVAAANMQNKRDHDTYTRTARALGDFANNGIGHGFAADDTSFLVNHDMPKLHQFKTTNANTARTVLNGMRQISTNNDYLAAQNQANQSVASWNNRFAAMNGGNTFKQAAAINRAAKNAKIALSPHAKELISNFNSDINNYGMGGFNNLSAAEKDHQLKNYNELVNNLKSTGSWNAIQQGITNEANDDTLTHANDNQIRARSSIINMAPSSVRKYLTPMSTDNLVANIGTGASVKLDNSSVDPNVLTLADANRSQASTDQMINRISNILGNIN